MHEEVKGTLNLGNACYRQVQNFLSSRLLSKNVKTEVYGTIVRPVLYGCETGVLMPRKEHRLRVLENKTLSRIFGHQDRLKRTA
jgi:hypothetical protein